MTASAIRTRIERLSAASLKRVIEPETEVTGSIGHGQIIPNDLLSIRDLNLDLDEDRLRMLAIEEWAAITEEGLRFESVLAAGFHWQIIREEDLTLPWVTYALHELGEETRHSRLFARLLIDINPTAVNPFNRGAIGRIKHRFLDFVIKRPIVLYTLVLAGEEIPDLYQKETSEHPDTDPYVVVVNRYHRQEEARHLAFARAMLPQLWNHASRFHRFVVRHVVPLVIQAQLEGMIHPGIYSSVGLPGWPTWWAVHRSSRVVQFRHQATRPILAELINADAFPSGRVPRGWRKLCGVVRGGEPVEP